MSKIDLGITITALNNASPGLRGASADVKKLGENSQATANRLKAIQVVIAGILIDKTLEYSKAIVTAIASTQALDLRMQAFAGSAAKADAVMSDLLATFGASPFKIDTISASWTRLRSAVQSNEQASVIIKAIVNDVAAMGGTDENINAVTLSFQRMLATGQASARVFQGILTQTGITLGDLAKAAGDGQFQRNIQNGFVNAQTFVDAFVAASNKRFGFFAQNLKSSVAGSISLVTNSISAGISHIGSTTDLNAHITGFFQNLATAIQQVMNNISQKDIDNFFDWLAKMEPLIIKTVVGLYNIGTAVLQIASVVGAFLGGLPPDALEFGILGYALFGRKGALVLGMIGAAKDKIAGTIMYLNTHDMMGNKNSPEQMAKNKWVNADGSPKGWSGTGPLTALGKGQKPGDNPFSHLLPNADQIASIKKMMADMQAGLKTSMSTPGNGSTPQLEDAIRAANEFAKQLNASLDITKDKVAEMNAKSAGDELGGIFLGFDQQGDQFNKQIADASAKFDALKIKTSSAKAAMAALRAEATPFADAIKRAKEQAELLYNIDTKTLQIQSSMTASQNAETSRQMSISSNQGGLFNAVQGTSAGQAIRAFQTQQVQYQQQIIGYSTQINDLQKQITTSAADPVRVAALTQQQQSFQKLQDSTQQALNGLTVVGTMEQQLWQNLGNTLTNDVADGISGLLQGTQSLGDVARKVFSDMIDMAVKYLIQLIEIKAISTFMGGFANGGVMPGGVLPFANGGIPQIGGNTKAFANGDILTGPTLFGLAGEAGDEAIMPLTRIGGKLGVRSAGGSGGDHYHIHLNAMDTQSGMQFVAKHINDIDGQLQQKKRLNRGAK